MRTLEQQRAADALHKVRMVSEASENVGKEFATYVTGLAPSIISNGLGQTCASLLARAKGNTSDPHHILYRYLQEWLCRDAPEAPYPAGTNLMTALVEGDRYQYLRAQAEALAWLEWMKRFSAAYLKTD